MCGEARVRVGFGPLLQGPRNSPLSPPYIQPLVHRLDFGFCLDYKFTIAATSRTSFVFNDQTKASHNSTFINKAFLIFAISILQSLIFACSSFARRKQTLVVRLIVLRRGQ